MLSWKSCIGIAESWWFCGWYGLKRSNTIRRWSNDNKTGEKEVKICLCAHLRLVFPDTSGDCSPIMHQLCFYFNIGSTIDIKTLMSTFIFRNLSFGTFSVRLLLNFLSTSASLNIWLFFEIPSITSFLINLFRSDTLDMSSFHQDQYVNPFCFSLFVFSFNCRRIDLSSDLMFLIVLVLSSESYSLSRFTIYFPSRLSKFSVNARVNWFFCFIFKLHWCAISNVFRIPWQTTHNLSSPV